ncbi:MAG: Nif3-like dinuclear metal center hexameric protein [Parachlamydiaceae bacterium]|nr:Nif3-like dinuclear metal center hexameric protein [Parachlamydiaceae bacterium]
MSTNLTTLINHLTDLLQPNLLPDYCVNGLQVQGSKNISKIATAVSASLSTIQAAVEANVNALIVHHGLFWDGDSPVVSGSKREKLLLLLQNNISLLAYHLPLDAHQTVGNNWKAAQDLGWTNLQPFGLYKKNYIGVQGTFPAMPRSQFQKQLELYYAHPATCALGGKELVSSAALISGGAYKSLSEAASAGIDCFITGNFDEPAWFQAFETQTNFFALGHSATERVGPIALQKHIENVLHVQTLFIDTPNPF